MVVRVPFKLDESVNSHFYPRAQASRVIGEQGNWRASEASETLFSHVYGISRYIYVPYGCPTLPGYATGRPVA